MRTGQAATILVVVAGASALLAQSPGLGNDALSRAIPAARRALYESVNDARDWRNPILVVGPDGIEVISEWLPPGRRTVPIDQLQSTLVALPVAAWPYGRVVVAQDNGLRDADGSHDEPIRRNHQATVRILKRLRTRVEWWPS